MTAPGELPPTVPVDWFTDGLLWAVNTTLLHPRGYALAVDPDTGVMTLQGDGTERWSFGCDDATAGTCDERFDQFHALLARATEHNGG